MASAGPLAVLPGLRAQISLGELLLGEPLCVCVCTWVWDARGAKSLAEPLPAAHRVLAGSSRRGSNAHGCSQPAVLLVGSVHGSRLLRTVEVELAGLV